MNNLNVKTFFPEAKSAAQAGRQIRIVERALSLEADGYELEYAGENGLYTVANPETGVYPFPCYTVNLNAGSEHCSCPSFANDGDCKHRIACAIKDKAKQDAAEVLHTEKMFAQWEAEQEETEMWNLICAEVEARKAAELF